MERDLAKTAKYFSITRPVLIKLMREKGLLNEQSFLCWLSIKLSAYQRFPEYP